jgi:Calcineurin-like phosphoesterase
VRPLTVVAVLLVVLGAVLGIAFAVMGEDADEGAAGGSHVLLAAGDIAECEHQGDEATAKILARYPEATIQTLGDNAYDEGSATDFNECYAPSWGRFIERTWAAAGNHDHSTKDAQGYSDYFGSRGGPHDKYYYSYDLGAWHVVVLDGDCWRVGGCELNDPQIEWLRRDLRAHPGSCTLAAAHRPPFSSGRYGDPNNTRRVQPMWQVLYEEGVDVFLTSHEHSYERFAPMNALGERDDERGVRLFVAGTGGGNLRKFKYDPLPTTEIRNDNTWGVLKLTLKPSGYDWEFLPVEGKTFTDSGSGTCH